MTGLAHTALIVIGFFSIFSGILPFSLDIDQTFIATPIMYDVTKKADAKKEDK